MLSGCSLRIFKAGNLLLPSTSMARYLTNRFHFAVRLYSDLTHRMTSKSGKNKEVRLYEPQVSSVTDALTTF